MLPVFLIQQIGLGLEVADFGQGQFDLPAVVGFLHGHIAPRGVGNNGLSGMGVNNFFAAGGGATEIGAETGLPVFVRAGCFFIVECERCGFYKR